MTAQNAAPDGLKAAQITLAHFAAVDPGRHCLNDELNPCDAGNRRRGSLLHWGGGDACPLCAARYFVAKATGAQTP